MALSELWFDVMCDSINRDLPCAVANENGVVEDEALGVVEDEDLGVVEDENLSVVDVDEGLSVAEVDAFSVVEELDIVVDVVEVEEDEENDSWDFKRIDKFHTKFNVFYCGIIVLLCFFIVRYFA